MAPGLPSITLNGAFGKVSLEYMHTLGFYSHLLFYFFLPLQGFDLKLELDIISLKFLKLNYIKTHTTTFNIIVAISSDNKLVV